MYLPLDPYNSVDIFFSQFFSGYQSLRSVLASLFFIVAFYFNLQMAVAPRTLRKHDGAILKEFVRHIPPFFLLFFHI